MYYIFWLYSISITSESISPPRELWDLISHFLGPLLYLHHGFFFVFTPNEKATIHIAENIITEEGSKIMVRKTETYQRYADFLNIKCCFILESEEWGRRIWSQNVEALPLSNYHILKQFKIFWNTYYFIMNKSLHLPSIFVPLQTDIGKRKYSSHNTAFRNKTSEK